VRFAGGLDITRRVAVRSDVLAGYTGYCPCWTGCRTGDALIARLAN
jgi:hypothetical protein